MLRKPFDFSMQCFIFLDETLEVYEGIHGLMKS